MNIQSIQFSSNNTFLTINQDFVDICDGDVKASILLSFLVSWHNTKIKNLSQVKRYNRTSEIHGEIPTQYEGLLQWHTSEEIRKGTFNIMSRNVIARSIKLLENKAFIGVTKNPNPKYNFDRTKYFLVNTETINKAISSTNVPKHKKGDGGLKKGDGGLKKEDGRLKSVDGGLKKEDGEHEMIEQYTNNQSNNQSNNQTNNQAQVERVREKNFPVNSSLTKEPTLSESIQTESKIVPQCNTVENKASSKSKKYYELKASDFKWINDLWKKYRMDWEQDSDVLFISKRALDALKDAYQTCECDLGVMYRLLEKALIYRVNNEPMQKYGIFWFIDQERFIEIGQRSNEKMLLKSFKEQSIDDEMNYKRAKFSQILFDD